MRESTYRLRGASRSRARRHRTRFPRIVFLIVAFGVAAIVGITVRDNDRAPRESVLRELTPVLAAPAKVAAADPYDPMIDPSFSLGHSPRSLGESEPLGAGFQLAAPAPEAPAADQQAAAEEEPDSAPALPLPPLPPAPPAARLAQRNAPLPVPRPSDLKAPQADLKVPQADKAPQADIKASPAPEAPRLAERQASRRERLAAAAKATAPAPEDNRNFFEKIFGMQRSSGPALAYAAPEDDVIDRSRGRRLSPTLPSSAAPVTSAQTAIYDISAKTVYMPNGERLEAHSGLGDKMDDVRFAHVRMQGVTPPHVYDLTEREALFHGVRALRLNPVGGSGKIFGRAGLLAHTYLLGPRGDSNGCVSFKDYERFLQAYLRGEVKRLVVVASM